MHFFVCCDLLVSAVRTGHSRVGISFRGMRGRRRLAHHAARGAGNRRPRLLPVLQVKATRLGNVLRCPLSATLFERVPGWSVAMLPRRLAAKPSPRNRCVLCFALGERYQNCSVAVEGLMGGHSGINIQEVKNGRCSFRIAEAFHVGRSKVRTWGGTKML